MLILSALDNNNILYINDLLNQNGEIDVNIILERLTKKHNWISEFNILKMSIPNQWKRILQSEDSINTRINIGTDFTLKYKISTMSISKPLKNKTIVNYVLKKT